MNKQNITLGVAVVAIILAITNFVFHPGLNKVSAQLDTLSQLLQHQKLGGISNYDQLGIGPLVLSSQIISIGSGTSTAAWTNTSNHTVFLEDLNIFRDGIATTSYQVDAEATNTAGLVYPATYQGSSANATSTIISGWYFATGTAATTTGAFSSPSSPRKAIPILSGQSILMRLHMFDGAGGCISTGICESASSTNKGFTVYGFLQLFATSSIPNNRIE